ncbi:MAG: hypothetical protein ACRDY5_07380 [Acidimicrobiales bacterium]
MALTGTNAVEGAAERALVDELDRLSLAQALRDVEVASARVADLIQRLIGVGDELLATRRELDGLRREHDEFRATVDQMRSSRAFRLANRIWAVRNALSS